MSDTIYSGVANLKQTDLPPARAPGVSRRRMLLGAKLVITLALCGVILGNADWAGLARGLRQVDPFLILLVLGGVLLSVTISAFKWRMMLAVHGVAYDFQRLHRYYFIAQFFNNFLPTSIGGDGYRIYKTLDNSNSKSAAVIAVAMERITGILALLCLGFVGGVLGYLRHGNRISLLAIVIGFAALVGFLALFYLITHARLRDWLAAQKRCPALVQTVLAHLGDYRRQPRRLLGIVAISIGFHVFSLSWLYALVLAVGGSLTLVDLAVVSAVMNTVAILPLSINGIGVLDGSFIYLAGAFGMAYEPALAAMLCYRGFLIVISVIGALLYFGERHTFKLPGAMRRFGTGADS